MVTRRKGTETETEAEESREPGCRQGVRVVRVSGFQELGPQFVLSPFCPLLKDERKTGLSPF